MRLLIKAVVAGLGAYAIGQTVAWREGPWSIFEKLREHYIREGTEMHTVFDDPAEEPQQVERWKSARARMLTCPYCMGMWAGLFMSLLIAKSPKELLIVWFGGTGVQVYLQSREHF